MTRHLSIDIETRSSVDIGKAGAYKYAQSPDFQILLFAYQMGEEPVEIIDLANGERLPNELAAALSDPGSSSGPPAPSGFSAASCAS